MSFPLYLLWLVGGMIFSAAAGILVEPILIALSFWKALGVGIAFFAVAGCLVGMTNQNGMAFVASAISGIWNAAFVLLAWSALVAMNEYAPLVGFACVFWLAGVVGVIMSFSAIKHRVAVAVPNGTMRKVATAIAGLAAFALISIALAISVPPAIAIITINLMAIVLVIGVVAWLVRIFWRSFFA